MDIKIYYCNIQLLKTAQFIWQNNPYVRNWPARINSVEKLASYIKSMAYVQAKKNAISLVNNTEDWVSYIGTGGFSIHFSSEYRPGDIYVDISIQFLVDAAVGVSSDYLTIETSTMVIDNEELSHFQYE